MNSIIAEEDNPATEESLFLKSENSTSLILNEDDDDDSPRLKAKLRAQRAKLEKYAHLLKRKEDAKIGAESESGGGHSSNTTPVPGS